jgi:hypothetical protein
MEVPTQPWWVQSSGRLRMIRVRYKTSYYQILVTHLQWKPGCCHHNIGLKPERKEEIHAVLPTMMQL